MHGSAFTTRTFLAPPFWLPRIWTPKRSPLRLHIRSPRLLPSGEGAGKDQAPEGSELYVRLGGFSFELKQQEGVKKLPTAINLAEIELMAQCDVAETCEEVAKHLTEIQSLISNVLIGVDYDTLLSQPGKGKLRDQIIERIERALGKGHIRNILFTKLVVS